MPVLHRSRGDEQAIASLDHSLGLDASLESWTLASPTLTLLPPFQPPPQRRPFNPQRSSSARVRPHASTCKSKQDHETCRHRHRDHIRSSPFAYHLPVCAIGEGEDITCAAIDVPYPTGKSARPQSPRIDCPSSRTFATASHPLETSFVFSPTDHHSPQGRSLTFISATFDDEMTTISTAPDSPPELSGSKSSKSSSYHSSSQFSTTDGVGDISNFEDVVLEDDLQVATNDAFIAGRRSAPKRLSSQATSSAASSRSKVNAMTSMRDLTLGKPSYPSLRGQVENAVARESDEALGPPSKRSATPRGFSSPSMPMLPRQKSERSRSRSRSPIPQDLLVTSPSSYIKRPKSSPKQLQPSGRRQSWQPNRKTVKELEAEYNDSDDELPDDTTLWNVPMSPRPPHARSSPQATSRQSSPDRRSPGPPPIPLAHSVSALDIDGEDGPEVTGSEPAHIPPRKSSLYSPPPPPTHFQQSFRDHRAKSWTLAMSDLSEEARVLTEALEYHADDLGRKHEDNIQRGGSRSTRPSLETSHRHPKSMIELPPLQKGNVMIDPLPISKEKEKVLTRTRPSWLPPKDPKEERRHLKEYQRMIAAAQEAEKRRDAKELSAQLEKDEARVEHNKVWEQYVYPEWTNAISEHRTRELWWKGVSPKMRGMVWQRAIGNELALTEPSYMKALKRADDFRSSTSQDDASKKARQCLAEIAHDAATVYPDLNLFQRGLPLHDALIDVLSAYAMYRNDIGYLQGLHLIAAVILLQVSTPSSAFILMANCLNRALPLACITSDPVATSRTHNITHQALTYKFPRVSQYLFNAPTDDPSQAGGLGLTLAEVLDPIFCSLLSNGLDLERLVRVWDCWVFEGDRTIVRATVAILGMLEGQICLTDGLDLEEQRSKIRSLLGWGPWGRRNGVWDFKGVDGGNEDEFMKKVREAGRME